MDSLQTLKAISVAAGDGTIDPEEAVRLREQILRSVHELYGSGTSIREIPHVEFVSNRSLFKEYQLRLLPPATESKGDDVKSSRRQLSGKSAKSKSAGKTRTTIRSNSSRKKKDGN